MVCTRFFISHWFSLARHHSTHLRARCSDIRTPLHDNALWYCFFQPPGGQLHRRLAWGLPL
jgi:hypothetical protein